MIKGWSRCHLRSGYRTWNPSSWKDMRLSENNHNLLAGRGGETTTKNPNTNNQEKRGREQKEGEKGKLKKGGWGKEKREKIKGEKKPYAKTWGGGKSQCIATVH